ncbi:hypothetical protein BU26DRAFT_524992 [Trematosphaeria pertusa]|uniref:Aminoglycoside phosphotransferase domain-containing protein n=1 Tax=Trematosphaeria pertusa TaxID=390896 RepID=A0A6A6HV15_9PLEO|nr:uncharacterized protein BU26DRAFT_524992 [Trematosphaeria pertusa]KAF2241867.1 hypothetical protein BU26DRAFT_524992 [Trematosphaeria pertusa]
MATSSLSIPPAIETDPLDGRYGELIEIKNIGSKEYITTEYSFTKRQPLRVAQGGSTGWQWGPQRLRNEALVLDFLGANTTVPTPKLYEHGCDSRGRYYVTMERIQGTPLSEIGNQCRQPNGVQHVRTGRCQACQQIADENADAFIQSNVLPQLRSLQSNKTGFDGFVLPPPRIVETRTRESWPVKTSKSKKYSLIHGDLARHNIMMSPSTLQVEKLFDWEHGGFFPHEMEREVWCVQGREYYDLFRNDELIEHEIALITP